MKLLFENWRKYLNETTPFGGFRPSLAGTIRNNPSTTVNIYSDDRNQTDFPDIKQVVKIVMSRNGKVLLLKNKKGWDLPGGHMKQSENLIQALGREVREET